MKMRLLLSLILLCSSESFALNWALGPFERADSVNPLITPRPESTFFCPILQKEVHWECDHTFNPAAVVKDGKVYLLYRAEDDSGTEIGMHTSRLGLAQSRDGLHFRRLSTPVVFPSHDTQYANEWPGGCEDPRIVEKEDGTYVMMYTQWNRQIALLSVATSKDLISWEKHGYAFEKAQNGSFQRRFCKSGSIICKVDKDRLIATKIQGKYWMYWGEGNIYAATSDDLLSWEPVINSTGELQAILSPRPGKFDSDFPEAGPPAVCTNKGIVFLYNGKNSHMSGDLNVPPGAYSAGQALFDLQDPIKLLARMDEPFFKPERPYEKSGQYKDGTVFIEGLVHFQDKWLLYYGTADSAIGVAVARDL